MITAAQTVITTTDGNVGLILLAAIIALLGWIGRQQIRWMNRIESKVNSQGTDIAVMKAVIGLKLDKEESNG